MKVTIISSILVYLNRDPNQGPKHNQTISLQIKGKLMDAYIQCWHRPKLGQLLPQLSQHQK